MICYLNGQYLSNDEARVSPDDRGFLFGDGVYEVVRAYGGTPFAVQRHQERLGRSLRELGIRMPDGGIDLADLFRTLLSRNAMGNGPALLYLQVTRGAVHPRKHEFPPPETPPTVYACVSALAPPVALERDGASAVVLPDLRWRRCDIKSVNLLGNILARQQALERGAFEAILERDGTVTEGSRTNVAAVMGDAVVTHPLTPAILPGVTRSYAVDLCRELGIPLRETPMTVKDLLGASEVMLIGTTCEVMPVTRIDRNPVGNGAPGPVTRRLQEAFARLRPA